MALRRSTVRSRHAPPTQSSFLRVRTALTQCQARSAKGLLTGIGVVPVRPAVRAKRSASVPLLRAAVWKGEVSLRAAEAVLPRARGNAEAAWLERAPHLDGARLKAAVKRNAADGFAPGRNAPG